MEWTDLFTTEEGIRHIFDSFGEYGIIIGFILSFIKAFVPFISLIFIIILNINSYGFWTGLFTSYLGNVLGTYAVFIIIRYLFQGTVSRFIEKRPKLEYAQQIVSANRLATIFIIMCIPFAPVSAVNIVIALSQIKKRYYLLILAPSRFVMIIFISIAGKDITKYFNDPIKLVIPFVILLVLYLLFKYIENKIKKTE